MADTIANHQAAHVITAAEAKARWDDLIAGMQRGEEWSIIDVNGEQLATLISSKPATEPIKKPRWAAFGMLKGQIEVAPDFDEPLEDFKPYME